MTDTKIKNEIQRIIAKYPDRIPVFCEKGPGCTLPDLDKRKFLVPFDLTAGQFQYVIRKRIKLQAEKALFLFINNTLPNTAMTMGEIYNTHKDENGVLKIFYYNESTFGNI